MAKRIAVAVLVIGVPIIKGISLYLKWKSRKEIREDIKGLGYIIFYIIIAIWLLYGFIVFLSKFADHITS